jgi:hypothetical protein
MKIRFSRLVIEIRLLPKPKPLPPSKWVVNWYWIELHGGLHGNEETLIEENTPEAAMSRALEILKDYPGGIEHDDTQIWPKGMTGAAPLFARVERKQP